MAWIPQISMSDVGGLGCSRYKLKNIRHMLFWKHNRKLITHRMLYSQLLSSIYFFIFDTLLKRGVI